MGFAITATDQESDCRVGEEEPAKALATEGEIVDATQTNKITMNALRKIAQNKPVEYFLSCILSFDGMLVFIGQDIFLILRQK